MQQTGISEVGATLLIVFSVIAAVLAIVIGIWVLDRSRRNTPAYALGRAMQDAWAALQAGRIRTGQAAPMPTTVQGLDDLAIQSMETGAFDPRQLDKQERKQTLSQIEHAKAQLDKAAKDLLDQETPDQPG